MAIRASFAEQKEARTMSFYQANNGGILRAQVGCWQKYSCNKNWQFEIVIQWNEVVYFVRKKFGCLLSSTYLHADVEMGFCASPSLSFSLRLLF